MNPQQKQYIYVVQVTRQLSVDILNAFVRSGSEMELLTGTVEYNYEAPDGRIRIRKYNPYNNATVSGRVTSGLWFTLRTFFRLLFSNRKKELILVSTPPFIFYTAWLLRILKGQRYHLVVWDLYPDVLVNLSVLKRSHPVIRLWSKLNTWCFTKASSIFTLGKPLAEAIKAYAKKEPVIIPNWVDTSFIVPIKKEDNVFADQHGLKDKLVVLYSGNLGLTHDVESIVYTAKELQGKDSIKFVIIGEGAKLPMIKEYVEKNKLSNVLILPYQDREMLPYSLTSADISVVTLSKGAETVSVPSKTYYSLASGSVLFGLASKDSELGSLIDMHRCGYVFQDYTPDDIARTILLLQENKALLYELKQNSRLASMNYTPKNAFTYYDLISQSAG